MTIECAVELCKNDVSREGLCAHHRKKAIKGQLDYDTESGILWDLCSRGHRWTPQNIHWEAIPGKTTHRRRCRKCLALKAARRRKSADGLVMPPMPVRPENEEMSEAIESLDGALSGGGAKCKDKYAEYGDYTAANIPTQEQARAMCKGCPFFEACGNSAYAQKPGWGVWAGEVWVYGEVFDETKRGILNDDD